MKCKCGLECRTLVMLLKNAKEADCNNSGVLSPCRGLIVITSSQKKKKLHGHIYKYKQHYFFSICTQFAL